MNLKANLKTLKAELVQRENIADSLKRQNKELRQALNIQASGKDLSMYTPSSPISNLEGPVPNYRQSKSSGKYSESRRTGQSKSRTPLKEHVRTIENEPKGKNIVMLGDQTASDTRLNKLI